MSTIPTTGTVTFTIKSVPLTAGGCRTVERLMRLERGAQRILKKLQKKRMTQLNEWRPRAGREWPSARAAPAWCAWPPASRSPSR